jgi:hypothetical protein
MEARDDLNDRRLGDNGSPRTSPPEFNGSQCSQLYINCCFALSLGGLYFLVAQSLNKTQGALFWWVPLSFYLVFTIWREYSVYYIPLQHYRPTPESDSEEFVTLTITLILGIFPVLCAQKPRWSLITILILVIFNLIKLRQMRTALTIAPVRPRLALEALAIFSNRLWCYCAILAVMILMTWIFGSLCSDALLNVISALLPLAIHLVARVLYRDFFEFGAPNRLNPTPIQYIQSVASAWPINR